jgi:hypothetical protein
MAAVQSNAVAQYAVPTRIDAAAELQAELEAFAARMLRPGQDYGVMPGTQRKDGRQTLYKSGAVKLCGFYGLVPVFEEDRAVADFERGLFAYDFTCQLLRCARRIIQDGQAAIVGDYAGCGLGSANSREKKYRRGARTCPDCGASTIKRSKYPPRANKSAEPGWYCHAQAGGCGKDFAADDKTIIDQPLVADPLEAAELVNTIRAMAAKRALVAAVLLATNASTLFDADGVGGPPADTRPARQPTRVDNGSAGAQIDGKESAAPSSPASTSQGAAVKTIETQARKGAAVKANLLKEIGHLLTTQGKTVAKAIEWANAKKWLAGVRTLEALDIDELERLVSHLKPAPVKK